MARARPARDRGLDHRGEDVVDLRAAVESNLRAFEREYRSRLKSYFTQQLESLNSGEAGADVEGSSPKRHRSVLGDGDN